MDILTVETLDGIVKALEGGSKNHRFDRTGHVAPQPFRQLDLEGIYAGGNDSCLALFRSTSLVLEHREWHHSSFFLIAAYNRDIWSVHD
jgi:hypothetical protein